MDYWGNEVGERSFGINDYITFDRTERFLKNINEVIEKNIFRKEIPIEEFFETEDNVTSNSSIKSNYMKEISNLYEKVRESKYKESFINYIAQRINENKINDISTVESNDDLPF